MVRSSGDTAPGRLGFSTYPPPILYAFVAWLLVPSAWWGRLEVEAVVLCARFPRRPRVQVSFFTPTGGQPRPDEEPGELASRLLAQIRERVPPAPSGRRRRQA